MSRSLFVAHPQETSQPEVNLTPLIDVVFVILIMFMIVAPLLELDQVELAQGPERPQQNISSLQEGGRIQIHVRKDNSILLNGQPVEKQELSRFLIRQYAEHPEERPQLYQDRQARFGTYQEVKNAVESAGFSQLDVVLRP